MLNSILDGIMVGFGVSLLVGPLFFGLIQLTIERGVLAGILFASGIWVSDLVYVRVVQLGLGYIGDHPLFQLLFGLAGSVILLAFGIGIFFGPMKRGNLSTVNLTDGISYFSKGAAINVFNPFVLLLWMGILSTIRMEPMRDQWIFVASMLAVVALSDVFKVFMAARFGMILKEERLRFVKRISGVIIGLFGVILLSRTLFTVLQPS